MKKKIILFPLLFIILLFFGCTKSKIKSKKLTRNIGYINKGNYLWLNQPNSYYYKGKYERTYFTFVKPSGKIVIQYFDHCEQKFGKEVMLYKFKTGDDHSNPSITIYEKGPSKGKIAITFSRHNSNLYFTQSNVAENINSFYTPTIILEAYTTYPTLIKNNNHLKIIFRNKKINKSSTNYIESTDLGVTWSPQKVIIEAKNNEVIYPSAIYSYKNELAISWSIHNTKKNIKSNIYYSFSKNFGKTWTLKNNKVSRLITRDESIKLLDIKNVRVFDITKYNQEYLISATEITKEGECCNSENNSFIISSSKKVTNFKTAGDYYASGAFFDRQQKKSFYYASKNNKGGNDILKGTIINDELNFRKKLIIEGLNNIIIRPMSVSKQKKQDLIFLKVNNYKYLRDFDTEIYYYYNFKN